MKIAKIESLHADAGQRNFDFLKITRADSPVLVALQDVPGGVGLTRCSGRGSRRSTTGPGWGTEVNEEAVRAHPPRKR